MDSKVNRNKLVPLRVSFNQLNCCNYHISARSPSESDLHLLAKKMVKTTAFSLIQGTEELGIIGHPEKSS
jgi:hypothetical protein